MEKNKFKDNLEKELRHPYLQTSYLDSFDLNSMYVNLPKISAIIPTYNRSPHSVEEDSNPLGWCLESLLAQEGPGLSEIVIIDDASTDFTSDVVDYFSEKSSIPIIYHKNPINLGSSVSKNKGIEMSGGDFVLFLDDDCVFSKYLFFGAGYTFNKLNRNIGALTLPIYHRKTAPDLISMKDIGFLDFSSGNMTANFNGFPIEYASDLESNFIEGDLKILKPFPISNLSGIFLSRKDFLKEAGSYPEFFTWKNSYREETHLGLELKKKGRELFFTPDPKLYCVHLKYGSHGKEDSNIDPTLTRLVTQSNIPRLKTGNRVDPEEWFFSRIISTFVTFGIRDIEAAKQYAEKTQRTFVEENNLSVTGVKEVKIDDLEHRRRIFKRAIGEGWEIIKSFIGDLT